MACIHTRVYVHLSVCVKRIHITYVTYCVYTYMTLRASVEFADVLVVVSGLQLGSELGWLGQRQRSFRFHTTAA